MGDTQSDALPYIGRQRQLEQAMALLRSGTGVLVAGPAGSGRTRFIREVANRLGASAPPTLWVGHDLNQLDEDRSARFASRVRAHEILPLASLALGKKLPEPIERLGRDGDVISIELDSLTARELLALVEVQLGGPLTPASISHFIPARGGRHLAALQEVISVATRSGALTWTGIAWELTSPIPSDEAMRRIVLSRRGQDASHPNVATILEILSLAPGLGHLAAIQAMETLGVPPKDARLELENLEDSGVIIVETAAPDLHLRIRDGIDELMITHSIAVLRRWRLATALVDVLAALPPTRLTADELIALAQHSLDLGFPLSGDTLTLAAQASLRTPGVYQSLRISTAAAQSGGGFTAEMAAATAEARSGLADTSLARLQRIAAATDDDDQRAEALQAINRYARNNTKEAAEQIDVEALSQLDLSESRRDLLRGFRLYNLGKPVEAAELITPALPELTGTERAEAYFHVGSVEVMLGHIERSAAALDEAEAAFTEAGADVTHVHLVRANVNVLRGRSRESLPVVTAMRDTMATFGQPVAEAMYRWAIGTLLVGTGRLQDGAAEFRSAIAALEPAGIERVLFLVRMDLAAALAQSGDAEGARQSLPLSSENDDGTELAVSGKILLIEGWIDAACGRRDSARATMIRAADAYAAGGFLLPAMGALIDAARVGQAGPLLERIQSLASDMDGEYVTVGLRLAGALAALDSITPADSAADSALADDFDEIGAAASLADLHIMAAEAYDHAAGLHLRAGGKRSAAASVRLRNERLAHCGLNRLPLVDEKPAPVLSARELDLARLAAAGISNREIAERLVLSVRTVETHLQTVYRKLGVRGRDQLPDALRSS